MSATPIAIFVLMGACILIGLLLPLDAFGLLGKTDGTTRTFKIRRYIAVIGLVISVSVIFQFALVFSIYQLVSDGVERAAPSQDKIRTTALLVQKNFSALNQEIEKKDPCYTAAISNWIEDQWRDAFNKETCKKGMCAKDETELFNLLRRKTRSDQYPLIDMLNINLSVIGGMMEVTWLTAKQVYDRIRAFSGILDPTQIGKPQIGTDQEAFKIYQNYIDTCGAYKPANWLLLGSPITPPHLCFGICP